MIKEKTIKDISTRVEGLLRHYQTAINGVFENDGKIKISMPVELSYDRTASISPALCGPAIR